MRYHIKRCYRVAIST